MNRKWDLESAREVFAGVGLELIEKEYKTKITHMRYRCITCSYEGTKTLSNQVSRSFGCPACNGKIACSTNNITVTHPHIVSEWDYSKNELKPEGITYGL